MQLKPNFVIFVGRTRFKNPLYQQVTAKLPEAFTDWMEKHFTFAVFPYLFLEVLMVVREGFQQVPSPQGYGLELITQVDYCQFALKNEKNDEALMVDPARLHQVFGPAAQRWANKALAMAFITYGKGRKNGSN